MRMDPHQRIAVKYAPKSIEDTLLPPATIFLLKELVLADCVRLLVAGDRGTGKSALIRAIQRDYYGGPAPPGAVLRLETQSNASLAAQKSALITFCRISPKERAKRRHIVVADDVELLPPPMQQTLRCCIDAHGHNVHFLMACTLVQKIAQPLRERLILIRHPAPTAQCQHGLLQRLCSAENIDMSEEARDWVLSASSGSIRSLLQHVEKLGLCPGPVDLDVARTSCSAIHPTRMDAITEHAKARDGGCLLARELYDLYDDGFSVMDILDAYFSHAKRTLSPNLALRVTQAIARGATRYQQGNEDEITLAVIALDLATLMGPGGHQEVFTESSVASESLEC